MGAGKWGWDMGTGGLEKWRAPTVREREKGSQGTTQSKPQEKGEQLDFTTKPTPQTPTRRGRFSDWGPHNNQPNHSKRLQTLKNGAKHWQRSQQQPADSPRPANSGSSVWAGSSHDRAFAATPAFAASFCHVGNPTLPD